MDDCKVGKINFIQKNGDLFDRQMPLLLVL